ncbi:MAG: HigA family addiction module antitoxin [Vulcanimicrobiaceae bacterium]
MTTKISPTHPGEVLLEDFMKPIGMSTNALAMALRVPVSRIAEITKTQRSVTAETALRLLRYFGTTPEFWIRLQGKYDLAVIVDAKTKEIRRDVRPREVIYVP